LEQCKEMALSHNSSIKSVSCSVEEASELRKEAFTKYFPEISAAGIGVMANHSMLQYKVLDLIELGLIKHGLAGGVQAMQPIFMGGQIINGNALAKVGEAVAELQKASTEREVALTTEKYYWKLATLKSTRETLLSAINLLDTLENQVSVAVDAGVAMRNNLLKVQIQRDGFSSDLVDLDNGIKLCRMVLSQYIGADFQKPIDIAAEVPGKAPECPVDLLVSPSDALEHTIDYQLLNKNVKAKDLELKMERGKYMPKVVIGAGWYYHDFLEQSHSFGSLQLAIDIPISGWWGGTYAIRRKKAEQLNANYELKDKSELLCINMQNKWDDVTAAHRKMEIASETIEQSSENLRLSRLYYEAGMSTITDLLEAQMLNHRAVDKYNSSYGDFRCAIAEYLNATGR
ncbi:MAG: TolC family protein, partial [Muribaculaceae bacterium]|nr:TolC family protein [Muribaculaceae bacterium]